MARCSLLGPSLRARPGFPTWFPRSSIPQVQIINKEGVAEANREDEGYLIKDGIVVIVKNAHIVNGRVI